MLRFNPIHKSSHRSVLLLGVLLPAYLLVVIGLFGWFPILWFGQQDHQLAAEDKGQMVEWIIHDTHDAKSNVSSQAGDHTLTVPCDDEGKNGISCNSLDLNKLPITFLFLYCWFIAWRLDMLVRNLPPLPAPVCRNSLSFLTRTVVLRH